MARHFNCCVPGCDSRGSQSDISFHKFPPDVDSWMVRRVHPNGRVDKLRRRKIWEDRLLRGKKAAPSFRVCSLHFESGDFLPTLEAGARKWHHLKKTALPTRNLPRERHRDAENDGPSGTDDKVLETELPDGTVCEFFTSDSPRSPSRLIADDGSTSDSAGTDDESRLHHSGPASTSVRRPKPSEDPLARLDGLKPPRKNRHQVDYEPVKCLRKVVGIFDFEGVIEALEKRRIRLPGPSWSYSVLDPGVLIFLCWDGDLRLIKKAVLRNGSSLMLSMFCDDRLLATRAELPVSHFEDLELALKYLDKYEWCPGADTEGNLECELYTLDGKLRCSPCEDLMTVIQNDLDDQAFDEVITIKTETKSDGDDAD